MKNASKLSFLVATIVAFTWFSTAIGADRPNILLIISDDQAWTDYGFMEHPHIETPRLDDLARKSLTYTRGYVSAPLCRPSLASILTGLPVHLHGTTGNDPSTGDTSIRNSTSRAHPRHAGTHQVLYDRLRSHPNIVRSLQQAGYATLQTGKWWEADPKSFGFEQAMTHGDPARGARHGDKGLSISRKGIQPIRKFLDGLSAADERNPFFIWHAPFLPHAPHNPPKELLEKYSKVAPSEPVAKYWAMCEWFDETCGELLDEIDRRDLSDNTVVLYFCDNGWIQHPSKENMYADRSKQTPYERGIRTPTMVSWPGHVEPRLDTSTLVSAIDLAPTVLNVAEVSFPSSLPGIDLRDTEALKVRDTVCGSDHPHDIPDVENPAEGFDSRYIIQGQWKLIVPNSVKDVELYNLAEDPYEATNLAKSRPAIVTRLTEKIEQWWNSPSPSASP